MFFPTAKRLVRALLCTAVLALSIPGAQAAVAAPAHDTLTRQQVSVAANHEIVFATPTGIDAPTDTVTLSFPGFGFGSVGVGDMNLFWGPVTGFENATSVGIVAAPGIWGGSISGSTITLTAPTDSVVSSIPAGSFIALRIGTNAIGGVNQLTNPTTPTNALISIAGTFGDTNVIGVPIVADDSVAVTAEVVAPTTTPPCIGCGSGGGNGGGGGPVSPVISNIQVINLTNTTARVTWDTDKNANSSLYFGFTMAYASGTVSDPTYVMHHVVDISGLTASTLYHFIVSSTDNTLLSATSADQQFTTLGSAPIISSVSVINITDTSALVIWDTDVPASSVVSYGHTPTYGSTASTGGLVTSHSVQLNGLTPSTSYHFSVTSSDASNNSSSSTDASFVTLPDMTPPANVNSLTATPGDTTVTLSWTNPSDPDLAGTRIMRKTGAYPTGPFDGTQIYSGTGNSMVDTGLTNGVAYYYAAYAFDTSGNFASGALASATPNGAPPLTPPTSTPPVPPPPAPTPSPSSTTPTPTPSPSQTPTASSTTPTGVTNVAVVAYYFGNNGAIELTPDAAGRIGTLAGSTILVSVPVASLGSTPAQVQIQVGSSLYALQKNADGTTYTASFVVPTPGVYAAVVTVTFTNGTTGAAHNTLDVRSGGQVVEETLLGPSTTGVAGATVQLYRSVGGVSTLVATTQTGADGSYGFIIPDGTYYVQVSKDGYRTALSSTFVVTSNVFNAQVSLIKIPVLQPLPQGRAAAAAAIAVRAGQQVSYGLKIARAVLQSPQVQAAAAVTAPVALALTLANAATSLSLFNALAYLQYLFTEPLLLFGRRKKRKWGVVFNSLTKQPVDLAIVRLVHFETRLVVQTKVTDKMGRFAFAVKKGNYLIEVVKPGYVFPTTYLAGKKEDVEFVDLYHGDKIEMLQDAFYAINIPLDPVSSEETPRRILFHKFTQRLRHIVAFSGVLLGMVVLVIAPTLPSALLLLAQIGVYLLFRRLAVPAKAKSWGLTFDAKTRKPIGGVIVRIFDKKFNKLLETQVTDQNGKYGFFVRRNIYYVIAQKEGYEKYTSPDINLMGKDTALVDENLPLQPVK